VLEAATLCSRLEPYYVGGVRLLDGGLELRREVHRRHELIEREPLRCRHGLSPRPKWASALVVQATPRAGHAGRVAFEG
jgi:hypothetical protein